MTQPDERLRAMLAEAGIPPEDAEDLIETLAVLERFVDETPPRPGPELAALMAGAARAVVVSPFSGRRGRILLAGAVAFGTVAAGGIAAAANELPSSAQTVVADFSERFLPFRLPHPSAATDDEPDVQSPQPAEETDEAPAPRVPAPTSTGQPPSADPTSSADPAPPTASPTALPTTSGPTTSPEATPDATPEPDPTPTEDGDGLDEPEVGTDPLEGADDGVTQTPDSDGSETEAAPETADPDASPSTNGDGVNSRKGGGGGETAPPPTGDETTLP